MGEHPNTIDYAQIAAERDLPVIERLIDRIEAAGRDASGWRLLLLRVKRQAHFPYREDGY